ncbi:hypothetical protein Esti_005045 [Eimeria stiedai]
MNHSSLVPPSLHVASPIASRAASSLLVEGGPLKLYHALRSSPPSAPTWPYRFRHRFNLRVLGERDGGLALPWIRQLITAAAPAKVEAADASDARGVLPKDIVAGGAAVCSVHPLEGFLRKDSGCGQWLQLLRVNCAGLLLPRFRLWGGSYREIIPLALPPPLQLSVFAALHGWKKAAAQDTEEGKRRFPPLSAATSVSVVANELLEEQGGPPVPREVLLGLSWVWGVTHLLPVQQLVLPLLLQQETDVLLGASAGTGKTLAAATAVLTRLAREWSSVCRSKPDRRGGGPLLQPLGALFLTPTRDTALQTMHMLRGLGRYTQLRVGVLVGRGPGEEGVGGAPWRCFSELQRQQPHVVVCTPGKAEELVQFLLAAEETQFEKTGQVREGIADLLGSCMQLVVDDAGLQLQEPLMLRAVAKLKELMPPGHQCIMLSSSLSWELQSCAARLMRVGAFCLNCLEGPPALTVSCLQTDLSEASSMPLLPSSSQASATAAAAVAAAAALPRAAAAAGALTVKTHAAAVGKALPAAEGEGAAGLKGEIGSAAFEVLWGPSCILDLLQPQVLWGPKRSREFLAKKRYEASRATRQGGPDHQAASQLHGAPSQHGGARGGGLRRPEQFVLYPPELHGHVLFNVLAKEAEASAAEGEAEAAAAGGVGKGEGGAPFSRVLVFFSSTKSLQFHYALFKHFVIPNANRLLQMPTARESAELELHQTAEKGAPFTNEKGGRRAAETAAAEAAEAGCPCSLKKFPSKEKGWPRGVLLPMCWALHSKLTAEKRRAVIDAFSSNSLYTREGEKETPTPPRRLKVLFCTDVAAVGVQLGTHVSLVLQVGAPRSVEVYVQRAARAPRLARKLLLLSDLDGHFLYESYKGRLPLREAPAATALPLLRFNSLFAAALGGSAEAVARRAAQGPLGLEGPLCPQQDKAQPGTHAAPNCADLAGDSLGVLGDAEEMTSVSTNSSEASADSCFGVQSATRVFAGDSLAARSRKPDENRELHSMHPSCPVNSCAWFEVKPLHASCELMYRSLLGMYAMQASRLKFERWQVPSFLNAMLQSIGIDEPPAVTKQMAARLQLIHAPGLSVDYHATSKTELLASLPSCPGFRSRVRQMEAEGNPPPELSAAFGLAENNDLRDRRMQKDNFSMKDNKQAKKHAHATQPLSSSELEPDQKEAPLPFAPVKLYPPLSLFSFFSRSGKP